LVSTSTDRDRERLESQLETDEYRKLLLSLQSTEPFLRRFATWTAVIAFMRAGTSTDPRKDKILRPIFRRHGGDRDPRWRTILLVIFWPGLESIAHRNCHWDEDPDELWQNVVWTFLQVICRVDLERRPARLVQKVVNDTIHYIYQGYERRWKRTNPELLTDPAELAALAGGVDGVAFAVACLHEAHEQAIDRLTTHLETGRITEADFLLLTGTRLYGQSVAEYARKAGLDYQVAKKRRQRAEAAMRRFEEELQ